jgi:hypothetical protein
LVGWWVGGWLVVGGLDSLLFGDWLVGW